MHSAKARAERPVPVATSSIGQRVPAGPLLCRAEDLEDRGLRQEEVSRISGAKVVFADHGLLQHDFPHLRDEALIERQPELGLLDDTTRRRKIGEILDTWLIRHAAIISHSQKAQTRVNTPIETEDPPVRAYRPTRYGRAHVRAVPGPGGLGVAGLLDIKGSGVGPKVEASLDGAHSNGLHFLGCAFLDMVAQWLVDEIFRRAAPDLHSVPTYAILDTGFDMKWRPDPRRMSPAAIQVRRAHRRAFKAIELPASDSPLQSLYLEIEMMLRHYGITSTTPGTTLDLDTVDGKLQVRYAGVLKTHLDDEHLERLARWGRVEGGRRSFEGVNIQIARRTDDDPARAQLVDFGHYKYHRRFEKPILSLVRDKMMKWGGVMWPDDPAFVQPDPRLCIPPEFTARRKDWDEIKEGVCLPFPNPTELEVTAFALARRFRLGEVDGDEVRGRLEELVGKAVARW